MNINRIDTNKKAHFTTDLGTIKKDDVKTIKIIIPSLDKQKEIVEYCEHNDALIKQLEQEIKQNKKQSEQIITNILKTE